LPLRITALAGLAVAGFPIVFAVTMLSVAIAALVFVGFLIVFAVATLTVTAFAVAVFLTVAVPFAFAIFVPFAITVAFAVLAAVVLFLFVVVIIRSRGGEGRHAKAASQQQAECAGKPAVPSFVCNHRYSFPDLGFCLEDRRSARRKLCWSECF
jgi:hypothetical protein